MGHVWLMFVASRIINNTYQDNRSKKMRPSALSVFNLVFLKMPSVSGRSSPQVPKLPWLISEIQSDYRLSGIYCLAFEGDIVL